MIQDLDRTLRELLKTLRQDAQGDGTVVVDFGTPDENYDPGTEALNLFLYQLKENRELRDPQPIFERTATGRRVRKFPLRVDCSYLVTAWCSGTAENRVFAEHNLL